MSVSTVSRNRFKADTSNFELLRRWKIMLQFLLYSENFLDPSSDHFSQSHCAPTRVFQEKNGSTGFTEWNGDSYDTLLIRIDDMGWIPIPYKLFEDSLRSNTNDSYLPTLPNSLESRFISTNPHFWLLYKIFMSSTKIAYLYVEMSAATVLSEAAESRINTRIHIIW